MAEPEDTLAKPAGKSSKTPLLIGALLALLGGGGAFYLVYSGVLKIQDSGESLAAPATGEDAAIPVSKMPDVVFVPVVPLVISVGEGAARMHLRFAADLEVNRAFQSDVETLMPRILDVMNTYLRALQMTDLEDRNALLRLRSQLLRRIQVVTGGGRINDLLVKEFVLN